MASRPPPTASTPLISRSVAGLFRPFPNPRLLWKAGGLLMAVGITAGAFGSHLLKKRFADPEKVQTWQTASHYALFNGIGLLVLSLHPRFSSHKFAGPAIGLGAIVFSGSIWALTLDREKRLRWLGPVTPLGGVAMLTGYISLLF